jgi:hypothetical protein
MLLLAMKQLLNQLFLVAKMKSSPGKLYGHHHDLVNRYGIAVLSMTTNMLYLLFMTITGLIARVTRWVSYMEQELLTLTKYLSSLSVLSSYLLLSLLFSVYCYCLFFSFCSLQCLFFIDLWNQSN